MQCERRQEQLQYEHASIAVRHEYNHDHTPPTHAACTLHTPSEYSLHYRTMGAHYICSSAPLQLLLATALRTPSSSRTRMQSISTAYYRSGYLSLHTQNGASCSDQFIGTHECTPGSVHGRPSAA